MAELKYEIVEHVGVIGENARGWNKELNLVSWNERIRSCSHKVKSGTWQSKLSFLPGVAFAFVESVNLCMSKMCALYKTCKTPCDFAPNVL